MQGGEKIGTLAGVGLLLQRFDLRLEGLDAEILTLDLQPEE
jgi:hypothetical protein